MEVSNQIISRNKDLSNTDIVFQLLLGGKISLSFALNLLRFDFRRYNSMVDYVRPINCVDRRHPVGKISVKPTIFVKRGAHQSSRLRGKYSYNGSASSGGLVPEF